MGWNARLRQLSCRPNSNDESAYRHGLEFEEYLKCGRLEYGFLRVRCTECHAEKLVAFSCKRRGFCPSCGARRMVESAALLVDEVLPSVPMRQWVLSVPFALRFLFACNAAAMLVSRFGHQVANPLKVRPHLLLRFLSAVRASRAPAPSHAPREYRSMSE
jgi:ribosomal protein S27E